LLAPRDTEHTRPVSQFPTVADANPILFMANA
jgi:hypothetical protein